MVSARVEASFSGGTTLLDTGCSGNAALIAGDVIVGSGVTETGADGRLQKYGDTPVVFSNVVRTNVSASGIAIKTRAYDTTTAAQLDLSGVVLSGASAEHRVALAADGVAAAFDNKNVGEGKAVSVSGAFRLCGRDAYRYSLTQPSTGQLKGTITPCTTVVNKTVRVQNISEGTGAFAEPRIVGIFGASASEVVETADGTVAYTVNAASLVNVSYDAVAAYLKTLRAGDSVELSYTFTGSGNYAGAKFDDGNGGRTDTGRITLQTVSGGFTGYVISFDLCGGSGAAESMTTGTDGRLVSLPEAPTRSGYTFKGWFTEPTGGTRITADTVFDADATVYAQWTPEYGIVEGADGVWVQESGETLIFRANGELADFTGVKVDGETVPAESYTAAAGSTVITLKTEYLTTLSVGRHTLTVVYSDGECSADFEIRAAQSGGATPDPDEKPDPDDGPQTGNGSLVWLWIVLLLISGGVLAGGAYIMIARKKKYGR